MQKAVYERIAEQMHDPIVEWRICRWTGEEFPIFSSEVALLETCSPTLGDKKFEYPFPTLAPKARKMRMMMFRNERKLYRRKCDYTGRSIISLYHPSFPGKVFSPDIWWSDQRDAGAFGVDYVSGQFLKQLHHQLLSIPLLNLFSINNTHSDYVNGAQWNTDCYMIFASDYNERCFHSYALNNCLDVVDAYDCTYCKQVYESNDCHQSSKVFYSSYVEESQEIYFSTNIINCHHCFLCTNIKDKTYCVRNQEVGKVYWENEIVPLLKDGLRRQSILEDILAQFEEIAPKRVVQAMHTIQSEHVVGNAIIGSKQLIDCYEIRDAENLSGVINSSNGCKDIMGAYVVVDESHRVHEGVSVINAYNSSTIRNARETIQTTFFSIFIIGSQYALGSIGIRNKQYTILNKEYSRSEREAQAKKIILELQDQGKRGEFFDPYLSPFPFNDTVAYELYPPKELVFPNGERKIIHEDGDGVILLDDTDGPIVSALLDLGGEEKIEIRRRLEDTDITVPEGMQTIHANDLPDSLDELSNDIVDKAIVCSVSGKPFRIVTPELAFYRTYGISLPRTHPDIRHHKRVQKRPKRELSLRNCDKTGERILSVYPSDVPFKVFSEKAYQQEVYG